MSIVKLIAVGDIFLKTKNNTHPFGKVKEAFSSKDILFGNLEVVLSKKGKKAEKAALLYSFPKNVEYLKDVGFDIINVANNHIFDLGLEGFNETLEVLNQKDLSFIGANNWKFNQPDTIIEKKGIKLGFLGYSECGFRNFKDGVFINRIDEDRITSNIKDLRLKCDVVIISLHWGIENVFYPSPKQIRLARNLVDAGANLILGHHPHVVQGIEKYKNGLIVYSLGNFQILTLSEKNKESVILSVEINKNGIEDYRIIPVKINENFIPYLMKNQESKEMLSFINTISHPIIEGRVTNNWWFKQIAKEYLIGNMKSWIVRIKKYGIKHFFWCIRWLINPFTVRCYLGLAKRIVKKYD